MSMFALFAFVIIIVLSMLVTRVGAIALEATGISRDIAQFQAMSAFTGVGFSTKESELIVNHPIRRKTVKVLMLMGNAGLTSGIATLILTFISAESEMITIYGYEMSFFLFNIIIIATVLLLLLIVSRTSFFDSFIRLILQKPLHIIKNKLVLYDYERILGLSKGYGIVSFTVPKRHWLVKKTIGDLKLEKEGINILGVYRNIHHNEEFLGAPSDKFEVHCGDKLVVYSREPNVESLFKRTKGRKGSAERKEAEYEHKKFDIIQKINEEKLKTSAKHNSEKRKEKKKRKKKERKKR